MTEKKADEKKAKRPTPQKRNIQNEKRRLHNKSCKSSIRTAIRHFEEALNKKDPAATNSHLNSVYSLVDKAVKGGVIKLNKGGRTKSRLAARLVRAS